MVLTLRVKRSCNFIKFDFSIVNWIGQVSCVTLFKKSSFLFKSIGYLNHTIFRLTVTLKLDFQFNFWNCFIKRNCRWVIHRPGAYFYSNNFPHPLSSVPAHRCRHNCYHIIFFSFWDHWEFWVWQKNLKLYLIQRERSKNRYATSGRCPHDRLHPLCLWLDCDSGGTMDRIFCRAILVHV